MSNKGMENHVRFRTKFWQQKQNQKSNQTQLFNQTVLFGQHIIATPRKETIVTPNKYKYHKSTVSNRVRDYARIYETLSHKKQTHKSIINSFASQTLEPQSITHTKQRKNQSKMLSLEQRRNKINSELNSRIYRWSSDRTQHKGIRNKEVSFEERPQTSLTIKVTPSLTYKRSLEYRMMLLQSNRGFSPFLPIHTARYN